MDVDMGYKTAKVWKVSPGSLQAALTIKCEAEGTVLMPRGCRFSPTNPTHLYVSAFIVSKATYIFVWNSETGSLIKKAKIHIHKNMIRECLRIAMMLTALNNYHAASFAINANGNYVAVGDVDGTVVVAETDRLRKVLRIRLFLYLFFFFYWS
jgi:hypothetical protein